LAASAIIDVKHRSRPDNDARQPAADTARRGVQSLPFQSADADQLLPPPFVSDGANRNFHQPKEISWRYIRRANHPMKVPTAESKAP
jgi:hypothetical protein